MAPSRKLETSYLVIKCSAPSGSVNLGVLGILRILPRAGILFFVGNPPQSIPGLDPFEMKLVSATPNAIREDLNQLMSQDIPSDKLLEEVSHRYRGTIFASERITKELEIPIAITASTSPQQILAQVSCVIMELAKNEKVALSTRRKSKRRAGGAQLRPRSVMTSLRQLGLPRQFDLTPLQI